MKLTTRADAFALRAQFAAAAADALDAIKQPSESATLQKDARYAAQRTALARWQTYSLRHFGLAEAYGNGWTALRRRVLEEEPTCQGCGGPSKVADHILPVALGGSPRARHNLQGLCQPCHSVKTALELSRLMEANWVIDPFLKPIDNRDPLMHRDFSDRVRSLDDVRRTRERMRRLFGQSEGTEPLPQGVAALSFARALDGELASAPRRS